MPTPVLRMNLLRELNALESLQGEALTRKYEEIVGRKPATACAPVLRRAVAYKLQADAYGDLDAGELAALDRAAGATDAPRPAFLPGTRLARTWHGTDIVAVVREDGRFEFAGRIYKSLSAIASAVTGTKWNGPAFFGIKRA